MLRGGKGPAIPGAVAFCALLFVLAAPASGAGPKCTIVGTDGPDMLHGKLGADVICGGGGNDRIVGGAGADRILGGPGDDRLAGGPGQDALLGGKGQDSCHDSAATVFAGCERGRRTGRPPLYKPNFPLASRPAYVEPPDQEAPSAIYLSFGGRFVDTSVGDTTIGLYVEAWDPSGIGSISVEIDGPDGPWRNLELEGGPNQRSALEASIEVPGSTPAGDYRLASLAIGDRKGNSRTLSAAEIGEAGYWTEFEVFEGPDEEAPELTSLSLSTTELDTSHAPATVDILIGASDALSGVNGAIAAVELPNWEPGPLELTGQMGSEVPPTTGTRHDGVWRESFSLVEHAMPGYYKIHGIYLSDLAGNLTHYTRHELEDLGYPVEFLETGGGDTTPPEILDLWFEPSHLRTSAGNRTIFFYTHVRDDITGFGQWPNFGLSRIETDFEPPGEWHEFSTTGRVPELVSGSEVDGVWRHEVVLEEDAPTGEYKLTYAAATDRAGNDLLLNHADIEFRGWPDSFTNEP